MGKVNHTGSPSRVGGKSAVGGVSNLADEFFEGILQCQDSYCASVSIHYLRKVGTTHAQDFSHRGRRC